MFTSSFNSNHGRSYGILSRSSTAPDAQGQVIISHGYGSGFAIAPGIIVTAAHVLYPEGRYSNTRFQTIEVMRAPDIGNGGVPLSAAILAESHQHDIAILQISNPSSKDSVQLTRGLPTIGKNVGAIGFPDTIISHTVNNGHNFFNVSFHLSFVGSHISRSLYNANFENGQVQVFSTDGNVYEGASGGPVFLTNGHVCGMQVGYSRNQKNERQSFTNCVPASAIIDFATANGIKNLRVV